MGSDKLYRWGKRRERKSRGPKSFHFDILDWVMLIMVCAMIFISLRLLFIFEITSAPCAEMLLTIGSGTGYPSVFELTFSISLLIGFFWLCVTLGRLRHKPPHWALILWHSVMFVGVLLLALMNWNLTSRDYVKAPDGIMVVETIVPVISDNQVTWPKPNHVNWADYRDGRWYASGLQSCIWLDENKVSYNDRFENKNTPNSIIGALFKGRMMEALKDNQLYRPLSAYERDVFLDIKTCQADITRYGQAASNCASSWLYPVEPGLKPPARIRDEWPVD